MSEVKSMKDEMNDELMELAIENIHKLIPEEWMPRINEILPKILNIVKIGIKKNIKQVAESLGNGKISIMMNMPHELPDKSIMMVPTFFRIDKRQLGPSEYNKATDQYELMLRPGEMPEATFSMLTLIEKINQYDKIEDLIKDVKAGSFLSVKDFNYTGDKANPENLPQKQITNG